MTVGPRKATSFHINTQNTVVTACTVHVLQQINKTVFWLHSAFMCFLWRNTKRLFS